MVLPLAPSNLRCGSELSNRRHHSTRPFRIKGAEPDIMALSPFEILHEGKVVPVVADHRRYCSGVAVVFVIGASADRVPLAIHDIADPTPPDSKGFPITCHSGGLPRVSCSDRSLIRFSYSRLGRPGRRDHVALGFFDDPPRP